MRKPIKPAEWHRFFVPVDGVAVACELRVEACGTPSKLRICDKQTASLLEKPRIAQALIAHVCERVTLINLLLEEFDMPWVALTSFAHGYGTAGAIIEAAEIRRRGLAHIDETVIVIGGAA